MLAQQLAQQLLASTLHSALDTAHARDQLHLPVLQTGTSKLLPDATTAQLLLLCSIGRGNTC